MIRSFTSVFVLHPIIVPGVVIVKITSAYRAVSLGRYVKMKHAGTADLTSLVLVINRVSRVNVNALLISQSSARTDVACSVLKAKHRSVLVRSV